MFNKKEFWTYKKIGQSVKIVFKINECKDFLTIHKAAQTLIDKRKLTMSQSYQYLNNLPHI